MNRLVEPLSNSCCHHEAVALCLHMRGQTACKPCRICAWTDQGLSSEFIPLQSFGLSLIYTEQERWRCQDHVAILCSLWLCRMVLMYVASVPRRTRRSRSNRINSILILMWIPVGSLPGEFHARLDYTQPFLNIVDANTIWIPLHLGEHEIFQSGLQQMRTSSCQNATKMLQSVTSLHVRPPEMKAPFLSKKPNGECSCEAEDTRPHRI